MDATVLIQSNPKVAIVILSLLVTLVLTVVNYFVTDKELMKNIKAKQKTIREEMKQYKHDAQKMMELNKKMMEDFPAQMKQSFKMMIITFIPIVIFYSWIRSVFATTTLASGWIWWYIISSIVFSIILRKAFKLD